MFVDKKITVTSISVLEFDFWKKKASFVNGRTFHSLSYRVGGKVNFDANGKNFVSTEGTLTYIPKGCSYTTEYVEPGCTYCVDFTIAEEYDDLLPELMTPSNPMDFLNLYTELVARFKPGRENDLHCMSLFYEILSRARGEYKKNHSCFSNSRAKKIKDRIDRDFSDQTISVALLAKEAKISEVYLRREFSSTFGVSPMAYIKKVRIENAKAQLRTGLFSVTEVALKCGFDSISYFSYEFHRAVGVTPKEYAAKFENDE